MKNLLLAATFALLANPAFAFHLPLAPVKEDHVANLIAAIDLQDELDAMPPLHVNMSVEKFLANLNKSYSDDLTECDASCDHFNQVFDEALARAQAYPSEGVVITDPEVCQWFAQHPQFEYSCDNN